MPANEDIDSQAELITTAEFTPKGSDRSYKFMRVQGQWQNWDGKMDSLQADQNRSQLKRAEKVNVHQGLLPAGRYAVFVGYRLGDGKVLFNAEEISVAAE